MKIQVLFAGAVFAVVQGVALAQSSGPYLGHPSNAREITLQDGNKKRIVNLDLDRSPTTALERARNNEDVSATQAKAFLAGKTRLVFDTGHGSQVSYGATDGRTYLWYPGNAVILSGRWEVRETTTEYVHLGRTAHVGRSAEVCFQYGANTYNPVTRERGGQMSCRPFTIFKRGTVEAKAGDVFGLAMRSEAPFVLGRERSSIEALRRRVNVR